MNSQRKTSSSKSVNGGGESSELIPIDLIIDIFSRLSAKSVYRFRCLSKFWASRLRHPDFTELFLTRSSSRPHVLFAFYKGNEVLFFSIPQPRNHEEIVSPVVATFVSKTSLGTYFGRFSNINGLLCIEKEWNSDAAVIYNPTTRQSFSIPHFSFFGYDPIEKQYKLLSIVKQSYKVLTMGSENLLWRDILCFSDHSPIGNGICIDGVLYYKAEVKIAAESSIMIVSFDIKFEKFNFMKNYIGEDCRGNLINYNGKLAIVKADDYSFVNGRSELLNIWVLEDPKKQEWSQHIHILPKSLLKDVVGKDFLSIVGMNGTDEIVLSSFHSNSSFYLVCYNTKKNNVVKVEIQGMEVCKGLRGFPYLNHVENLKLLC